MLKYACTAGQHLYGSANLNMLCIQFDILHTFYLHLNYVIVYIQHSLWYTRYPNI